MREIALVAGGEEKGDQFYQRLGVKQRQAWSVFSPKKEESHGNGVTLQEGAF